MKFRQSQPNKFAIGQIWEVTRHPSEQDYHSLWKITKKSIHGEEWITVCFNLKNNSFFNSWCSDNTIQNKTYKLKFVGYKSKHFI